MLPKEALHVTDLSEIVPRTVAVNASEALVFKDAVEGEIATEVTPKLGGAGTAVITTMAEAD
jgi:hypothetical protein